MKKIKLSILLAALLFVNYAIAQSTTNTGENSGTGGTANSFFGNSAGKITTGNENTFIGYFSGISNTTGRENTFLGYQSGNRNTTGNSNTFIGRNSGYYNTTGSYNVFNGRMSGFANTTGYANVFTGFASGYNNTTGRENTFLGNQSGNKNTTGSHNTFTGRNSGYTNTTGSYNVFNGRTSGFANTTGYANVFMGYASGYRNTIGRNNTYLGHYSGYFNTTGKENTFMGGHSGHHNTTGIRNTFIGQSSGLTNTTGNGNVFIGASAGYNELNSNKLYIDNSGTATPLIYGDFGTNQLGINTNNIPTGYAFAVKGKMITEEVRVALEGSTSWPDYVFASDYKLPTLIEIENFIAKNGHLPNIPSAKTVHEEGFLLGNMNAKLLEKIEELMLYTIQQEKELKATKEANNELEARLLKLEALVEGLNKN